MFFQPSPLRSWELHQNQLDYLSLVYDKYYHNNLDGNIWSGALRGKNLEGYFMIPIPILVWMVSSFIYPKIPKGFCSYTCGTIFPFSHFPALAHWTSTANLYHDSSLRTVLEWYTVDIILLRIVLSGWVVLGWVVLGWVVLGWVVLGWVVLGWVVLGWVVLGWVVLGWVVLEWVVLGWVVLGWVVLGWVVLGWVVLGWGTKVVEKSTRVDHVANDH